MPIVARVTRSQPNEELENFELNSSQFGQVKSIIENVSDPGLNAAYQVTIQPGDYTGLTGINVPAWVNVVILPGAEFTDGAFTGETSNVVDLNDFASGDFKFPEDVTIEGKLIVKNNTGSGNSSIFQKNLDVQNDLSVTGQIFGDGVVETSSLVHKKNITPLKDGHLKKVNEMIPVEFQWKKNDKTDLGLIAEQVDNIYPQFIERDENNNVIGIRYSKLTSVLIQSIKELTKRVEKLEES